MKMTRLAAAYVVPAPHTSGRKLKIQSLIFGAPLMKRLLVLAAAAATLVVHAQTAFPTKPITIVATFAAGGPVDRVARDLAEALRKP